MRSVDLGTAVRRVITRGKQSPGTEVRIVKRASDTITVAVGKEASHHLSGGIVRPVCICCGGPAHATMGH